MRRPRSYPRSLRDIREYDNERLSMNLFKRSIIYLFEAGELDRMYDQALRRKSYVSFYYFVKWLTKTIFLLSFTLLGSVAGKEIACLISQSKKCREKFGTLIVSSPHIFATLSGMIFGALSGQWFAVWLWKRIRSCIRKSMKVWWVKYVLCGTASGVFIVGVTLLFDIFLNIREWGIFISISLNIIFLIFAYRKKCIVLDTPNITPDVLDIHIPPIQL